MEVKSDYFS